MCNNYNSGIYYINYYNLLKDLFPIFLSIKTVSMYEQEMPQSHNADQPTAPC